MKRIRNVVSVLLCMLLISSNVFAASFAPTDHGPHDCTDLDGHSETKSYSEFMIKSDTNDFIDNLLENSGAEVSASKLSNDIAKRYSNSVVVPISDLGTDTAHLDFLEKNSNLHTRSLELPSYMLQKNETSLEKTLKILAKSDLEGFIIMWVDGNTPQINFAVAASCWVCGNSQVINIITTVVEAICTPVGVTLTIALETICYFNHVSNPTYYYEYLNAPYCYSCGKNATWQGNYNWRCTTCGNWF